MRVAVLTAPRRLELSERPVPEPGPGQVLVRVTAVGVCGSDVHYWDRGAIGPFVVRGPLVLGHEAAGEVVAIGSGVDGVTVGQHVAMEPGVPCGGCDLCRSGRYNLCPDVVFWATPPVDGTFCEYVVHPAAFCFPLPPGCSDEAGALAEPLSTGVHAVRRGRVGLGGRVLVTGLGPIGLVTAMAAFGAGARVVYGIDPVAERRRLAAAFGVLGLAPEEAVPEEVDTAVDCSGAAPAIRACCAAVRPGGVMVQVGMGTPEVTLPLTDLQVREVDFAPVFRYAHTYPAALALIASGRAPVERLITHRFPLARVQEAFELSCDPAQGSVKVMIDLVA